MEFDVCRPVRENMGVSIFHNGHLGGESRALRFRIGIKWGLGLYRGYICLSIYIYM